MNNTKLVPARDIVDGIKRGEVRCEICKQIYKAGAPHGCKTKGPK